MPRSKRQNPPATVATSSSRTILPRKAKTRRKRDDDDDDDDDEGEEGDDGFTFSVSDKDSDEEVAAGPPTNGTKKRKLASTSTSKPSSASASSSSPSSRSLAKKDNDRLFRRLFGKDGQRAERDKTTSSPCCIPPSRRHAVMYHRPLLLDGELGREGRRSLLAWFDSVSETRSMPWRKPWVNPRDMSDAAELRRILERRAYEVWISEIMLQQTRVAVVVDYWNRWMSKWPTIHDLAAAKSEDVLAAWSGLGYYSRATRIHEAARLAVGDPGMRGLLPASAKDLEAKLPGVGRYTAGAISSIVFGRAEPMVDGNVLRVLSRQLGIHGNIKTNRAVIDAIWTAADAIVKAIAAQDGDDSRDDRPDDPDPNDRPGRWGQALMELGSTVCTPKPNCALCPITSTCRVYGEGESLAKGTRDYSPAKTDDIEDLCNLCDPFEQAMEDSDEESLRDEGRGAKKSASKPTNQPTLAAFAFTKKKTNGAPAASNSQPPRASMDTIINYARRFPVKVIKKAVREEETLVCAIRRGSDGHYLIHRRPPKGLLAGLWELPSQTMEMPAKGTAMSAKKREQMARRYVSSLLSGSAGLAYGGELGSVPWLFSHMKLTMHVHLFTVDDGDDGDNGDDGDGGDGGDGEERKGRWVLDVDGESMGTGMRKCWAMVKEAVGDGW